jgi:DNA-binding transcriptional ArsR family regulator
VADPLGIVLAALADPSRRALLQRLAHGPATSGQLAELLPTMSRPAASQHLRVLVDAGLLRTTVRGRQHWHELATARLSEVEHWIHTLVGTWTAAPTLTLVGKLTAEPTPALVGTSTAAPASSKERHDRTGQLR